MKKYCEKCGSEMLRLSKTPYGYDKDTGRPLHLLRLQCPNVKHWWDKHDSDEWIVWDKLTPQQARDKE